MKKLAKLSPKASAYVYDLINRQVFNDLAWHERMLADRVRVDAYRNGIAGSVKPGDTVIDLGTGILAFMACQAGAGARVRARSLGLHRRRAQRLPERRLRRTEQPRLHAAGEARRGARRLQLGRQGDAGRARVLHRWGA
jgi:hypothetical protein